MNTLARRVAVDDSEAERSIAALYSVMRALGEATHAMVLGVEGELNHQLSDAVRMLEEIHRVAVGHSDKALAAAARRGLKVVAGLRAVKL